MKHAAKNNLEAVSAFIMKYFVSKQNLGIN